MQQDRFVRRTDHQEGHTRQHRHVSAALFRGILRRAGKVRSRPVTLLLLLFALNGRWTRFGPTEQMSAGKQGQPEPVRVRAVRIGSSQLHRHEIRHGGTEDRPVHRPQPSEIRSSRGNAGNEAGRYSVPMFPDRIPHCSDASQEKLEWDTGLANIFQAVSIVVGAEQR